MQTLHIYKTNNHFYCQVIEGGNVKLSCSTLVNADTTGFNKSYGNSKQAAEHLAHTFSKQLLEQNMKHISLQNRIRYHGRIKSFVTVLRKHGITIS